MTKKPTIEELDALLRENDDRPVRINPDGTVTDLDAPAQATNAPPQGCSCYPGERPEPCQRKHAFRDCWRVAVLEETQSHIVQLKNRDRSPIEQEMLDYFMRVRTAVEA